MKHKISSEVKERKLKLHKNTPKHLAVHTVYRSSSGEVLPSVTTVLKEESAPALMEWAFGCGVAGRDYKALRDEAGKVGTEAHRLIAEDGKEQPAPVTDIQVKGREAYENYCNWKVAYSPQPELSEISLVSEEYGFGGTFDLLCTINDIPTLVDFKTSKQIIEQTVEMQLHAYRILCRKVRYGDGMPVQGMVVRIGHSGHPPAQRNRYDVKAFSFTERTEEKFLTLLKFYKLKHE